MAKTTSLEPFVYEGKQLFRTKEKPMSGGRTQLYYCPLGEFYSVSHRSVKRLTLVFDCQRNFQPTKNVHSYYPILLNHKGKPLCHIVALETMVGERPEPVILHGKTIPYQADHINGNIFDFSLKNLRWVRADINYRDAGFLRKLRNNGIDPTKFDRGVLLAFFEKMALYKRLHGQNAYERKLTKPALLRLLVGRGFDIVPGEEQINREMERHCEV